MNVWHAIGRQFRHPSGLGGRLMGGVMRVINDRPNRLAIDALDLQPGQTVLELGCGPGAALAAMHRQEPGAVLHGLDQSAVMLAQAARRNHQAMARRKIILHRGDFSRVPLADNSVDRILGVNVVYFWHDIPAVMRELNRILRPRGRIALYATDAASMRGWRFAGPETHRIFSSSELEQALAAAATEAQSVRLHPVRGGPGVSGLIAVVQDS